MTTTDALTSLLSYLETDANAHLLSDATRSAIARADQALALPSAQPEPSPDPEEWPSDLCVREFPKEAS